MNGLFHGDRPIESIGEDRLGFEESARHIARALVEMSSTEGFVIGVEGEWGSGKTSFINLVCNSFPHDSMPEIIRFSPWLISFRDVLLDELFGELSVAVSKIEGHVIESKEAKLANSMRRFAGHLSKLSKLASVAEVLGLPFAGLLEKTAASTGEAIESFASSSSLDDEKSKIEDGLRELDRKIVVFVDDLDRLEPAEAGEIVRLVRAVADFPNVVYVLCYSREVLSESLKHSLSLGDKTSEGYLDKIVQVSFAVPKPEEFELRRMLRGELSILFPEVFTDEFVPDNDTGFDRLSRVIDLEGGKLLTSPRSVMRCVNSMRLYALPIVDQIDMADMLWLQLIRLRSSALFDWVQRYLSSASSVMLGTGIVSREFELENFNELSEILDHLHWSEEDALYRMSQILPGIERRFGDSDEELPKWKLFANIAHDEISKLVRSKRLGSPHHYRYFFALSKPKDSVGDAEINAFLDLCKTDPDRAGVEFQKLAEIKIQAGVTLAGLLINRLRMSVEDLLYEAIPGILIALSAGMDQAALTSGKGDWGKYWVWGDGTALFKDLLIRLPDEEKNDVLKIVFNEGTSIGWLSRILRDELFAHGVAGSEPDPEENRLFNTEQLDLVRTSMVRRFRSMKVSRLKSTPGVMQILYAWLQNGAEGEEQAKTWIVAKTRTNIGLLDTLEQMKGWGAVNGKVHYPLRERDLQHFFGDNLPDVLKRLNKLSEHRDDNLSHRASNLLKAYEKGR